jgi:nucleoside-diphosphate-sugar epimerase
VLLSSAKVHGEATQGAPLRADRPLAPADAYGEAKARMEKAMQEGVHGTGTALAVIRPPLIYGPGVKSNFLALLRLVRWAPVLPLGGIANRRSFLYLGNLIDLLSRLLGRADRVSGAFLACDGEDLSTPELIRQLGRHLGRVPALPPCPPSLLRLAAAALGRRGAIARLTDSFQLDDAPTRRALQWAPPHAIEEGLRATCRWFLEQERSGR